MVSYSVIITVSIYITAVLLIVQYIVIGMTYSDCSRISDMGEGGS